MKDDLQPLTGRLAHSLQYVLAVEMTGMAVAAFVLYTRAWTASGIALALLLWFFGFRAFIVSKNFFDGERHKSPRLLAHQLDPVQALRLWWGEYWITAITYSFIFPIERWLMPAGPLMAAPGKGTPILLVPGFICNLAYWWFYARALKAAGLGPVYAVTLEPVFGSIDENARHLGRYVEAICAQTGAEKVVLIGHSMGGVTARVSSMPAARRASSASSRSARRITAR